MPVRMHVLYSEHKRGQARNSSIQPVSEDFRRRLLADSPTHACAPSSICPSIYPSIYPILSSFILSDLLLSHPIPSYPFLSYSSHPSYASPSHPIQYYLILSYPFLSYPILSHGIVCDPTVNYRVVSHPISSYLILSCLILSYLTLSHLIFIHIIFIHFILSYVILSYLISSTLILSIILSHCECFVYLSLPLYAVYMTTAPEADGRQALRGRFGPLPRRLRGPLERRGLRGRRLGPQKAGETRILQSMMSGTPGI